MSTLRLMIPEWHGGLNPNYVMREGEYGFSARAETGKWD